MSMRPHDSRPHNVRVPVANNVPVRVDACVRPSSQSPCRWKFDFLFSEEDCGPRAHEYAFDSIRLEQN